MIQNEEKSEIFFSLSLSSKVDVLVFDFVLGFFVGFWGFFSLSRLTRILNFTGLSELGNKSDAS